MKILWAIRYAWHMHRMVGGFRYPAYLAKVAYLEYEDWEKDSPKFAAEEEVSCWYE